MTATYRHLVSSVPIEHLRQRLKAADLAILDMDGSLHWGITQGVAALRLFWRLARHPDHAGDRRFLVPILLGGASLTAQHLLPAGAALSVRNRRMIDVWCRTFAGVPMTYFRRAARLIPSQSFPGVRETIERLARGARVGIISVGLDLVVHEYVRQFMHEGEPLLTFFRCNRMAIQRRRGREVFAGRYRPPMIVSARDKAQEGLAILYETRPAHPLVIGNDEGDVGLVQLVRRRNGLAIGVCPPRRLRPVFDAYLTVPDWSPLAELLEE